MDDPFSKIATLTDAELETRINDLTRKYWKTHNPYLQEQIVMQLDAHKDERRNREAIKWQESQKNLDNGLDNLINID